MIAILGICNNLGLQQNARCLWHGQELRRLVALEHLARPSVLQHHAELEQAAIDELKRFGDCDRSDSEAGWTPAYIRIPGIEVPHRAEPLPSAVGILRLLCHPHGGDGFAERFNQLSTALSVEIETARADFPHAAVVPPGLMLVSDDSDVAGRER